MILIERTDDLVRLQQKLIDAVAPFSVETGTAAAFVTTPEDPDINQPTIDYVAHYVPASSGDKLEPHVTIAWPLLITLGRWSPNRSTRSDSRPWQCRFTSSAISGRLER